MMANRGHLKHQKPITMCYFISPYHFLCISIVFENFQGVWGGVSFSSFLGHPRGKNGKSTNDKDLYVCEDDSNNCSAKNLNIAIENLQNNPG